MFNCESTRDQKEEIQVAVQCSGFVKAAKRRERQKRKIDSYFIKIFKTGTKNK